MVVFSRYYVLGISVLAFPVLDSELRADVDSFKLYLVVNLIPSQNADLFSPSVELSKSSGQYLVDLNFLFDPLVPASLSLVVLGLRFGTTESFGTSFDIIQVCYFL